MKHSVSAGIPYLLFWNYSLWRYIIITLNMSTELHKMFFVLRLLKCESAITVQHDFRRRYGLRLQRLLKAYVDSVSSLKV